MTLTQGQTVEVVPGHRLAPDDAASFRRVCAQLGYVPDINSMWRDPRAQQGLRDAYLRDPKNNPIALDPKDSRHCWGDAWDTDDHGKPEVVRVLNENGWFQTVYRVVNGKRTLVEPWHFERDPSRDQHRNEPTRKGLFMYLTKQQEEEIYNNICGASQRPLAKVFAQELLDYAVPRATGKMGGNTNLRGFLAYSDHNNIVTRELVAELAHAIAEHVSHVIAEHSTDALTGIAFDPEATAKATADEIDARFRQRLETPPAS